MTILLNGCSVAEAAEGPVPVVAQAAEFLLGEMYEAARVTSPDGEVIEMRKASVA